MFEWFRRRSRDRFARRVIQAIAKAGGATDFVYDRENFLLRRTETVANLGNTYLAFNAAKGALRDRVLQNFVTAFTSNTASEVLRFDDVKEKLVAVVREKAFIALMRGGQVWQLPTPTDPKMHPAFAELTSWFVKAIAIDFPTHVIIVNESHLKDWGVTFEEAFELGCERLKGSTVPRFRNEGGVYVGEWNDDYDSSRALIPSIFDDLPLNGDPVVCLPNRLSLFVVGSNDLQAIRTMLARAENVVQNVAKPQNPAPLVVRGGQILDYEVEVTSPIYNEVQRARKFAALVSYEEQRNNLERIYKDNGKEYFVAKFTLVQNQHGAYESVAVWSKGVSTLLPEVDTVMFFDESRPEPDRMLARVPWHRIKGMIGDLLLDTKMFPVRFFVSEFPTPEQFVRLSKDS